jgi:nucleoside-diphosphate-sugar epimerase
MKIHATGSTGTIGRHFSDDIVPINIRLESELSSFLKLRYAEDDIVIHAGARVGPKKVSATIQESFKVNVMGTRNLAISALQSEVTKFVYISTGHVYKFGPEYLGETELTEPINSYAEQKYLGEREVLDVYRDFPDKVCILRVFSLLGAGMPAESLGGAATRVLQRQPNFHISNGDDIRDFLTPMQVAKLIVYVAKSPLGVGVINLCSGVGLKISEAVSTFIGKDERFEIEMLKNLKGGTSENPRIVGDNTKIRKLFPELNLQWEHSLQT